MWYWFCLIWSQILSTAGSSVCVSDWSHSTSRRHIQETLRWFCWPAAEFSGWSGSSRTGSGSRPTDWRFSGAECPERRPVWPRRAPWRSVASGGDQRKLLQRTQCTTTTHSCLQTVPFWTVTTTSGPHPAETLLPSGAASGRKMCFWPS